MAHKFSELAEQMSKESKARAHGLYLKEKQMVSEYNDPGYKRLVAQIQETTGLTEEKSQEAIYALVKIIWEDIQTNGICTIPGLGTFSITYDIEFEHDPSLERETDPE